jgi:peptidoglycan/LPS O-acetylase OafA/YrhL
MSTPAAATVPREEQPGRGRFLAGDALRGLGCVAIIIYHVYGESTTSFAYRGSPTAFSSFGDSVWWISQLDVALYVFLALSGYLIARPFLVSLLTGRPTPNLRRYAQNRLVRIVPAFWVSWTIILVIWGTEGGGVKDIVSVYAFLQNYFDPATTTRFVQGWTVGIEMLYYALLPLTAIGLIAFVRRTGWSPWRTLMGFLLIVTLASLALRSQHTGSPRWERSFPVFVFAFVPGIVLAAIEVRWAANWRGAKWGPKLAWALVGVAVALYVLFVVAKPGTLMLNSLLDLADATAMVAAPLVLQWTTGRNWWLFSNPVSVWFGSRSYSIYLYHVAISTMLVKPVLLKQSDSLKGFLVALPLITAVTFVLAEISFRLVEQPALRRRAGPPHQAAEAAAMHTKLSETSAAPLTPQHILVREEGS